MVSTAHSLVLIWCLIGTVAALPADFYDMIDLGCYHDVETDRDLDPDVRRENNSMTVRRCLLHCLIIGKAKYAGLQNGYACMCGDQFGKYGRAQDWECDVTCSGDDAM